MSHFFHLDVDQTTPGLEPYTYDLLKLTCQGPTENPPIFHEGGKE